MSIAILNVNLPPLGCRKVKHGRPLGFPTTNTQTIVSDDVVDIGHVSLVECSKETLSNYNNASFYLRETCHIFMLYFTNKPSNSTLLIRSIILFSIPHSILHNASTQGLLS